MPAFNVYGAADLAQLAQAYRDAEANILRLIAQALEKGAEGTGNYYKAQYSELNRLRREADAALNTALEKTNQELAGLLAANAQGAAAEAVASVMPPAINTDAVNALTLETAASMASMKSGVLRSVNDTFRQITRVVSTRGIMSGETMKDRLQAALNEYAAKGLTAYTDAVGRQWKIDSYAEMALRTATNRAQNQGRAEQFKNYGISLVRTSQHMGCSDLCLPYQGKILSLDGRTGTVTELDPATGNNVTVTITATMNDAIANGYHHPNCRHTDTAYIPGTPDPEPIDTDTEEAAAEQAQRYNERQIRAWKRREAVAITPQEKAKASAKVRQWQAQQREHLKANPWLQRRYDREQVRAGVAQRAAGLPAEPRLMPKPSTPAPAPTPTPDVPRRRRRAESGESISVAEILARNKKPAAAVDTSAEALKKAKLAAPLDHVDIPLLPDAVFKEKTPTVTLSQLPKTTRTSWDDIAKEANVNKGVGNCIRVANTVELRRRGYDVTAGQTEFRIINRTLPNQTILKQSMRTRQELAAGTAKIKPSTADIAITGWNTADGGSRVYFQARKAQSGVKYGVNGATLKRFQDDMPDGASGTAVGAWKKQNFGHIWNWVKQDGKIRFFEAQSNKGFIDVEEYMPNLSNGSLMMVRMDDLTPNDNVLKVIDYENRI